MHAEGPMQGGDGWAPGPGRLSCAWAFPQDGCICRALTMAGTWPRLQALSPLSSQHVVGGGGLVSPHLTGRLRLGRSRDLSEGTATRGRAGGAAEPRLQLLRVTPLCCPPQAGTWPVHLQSQGSAWAPPHFPLLCLQITGPWRSLWIRFGYDPRRHPEAKIYQVLDFRIRCGMKSGKNDQHLSPLPSSCPARSGDQHRPRGGEQATQVRAEARGT